MKAKTIAYFPLTLVIFHSVGLVLFMTDPKTAANLSYLNTLLCGILVMFSEKNFLKILPIAVFLFITSIVIEIIGTKTGYLFGNYTYGQILGPRIYDIPLIIGVNWFVTIAACSQIATQMNSSPMIGAIISGVLAMFLDLLIEPVAVKYGFWSWKNGEVPIYNAICWFVFSTLFSYFYLKATSGRNTTACYLFFTWTLFFISLNLI